MGVDLALHPVSGEDGNKRLLSFSRLEVERRRELWPVVAGVPAYPVKEATSFFGDEYCDRKDDCYGSPLRFVLAKDLAAIADNEAVQDNHLNRAVWAYLAALDPDTKIILYWH